MLWIQQDHSYMLYILLKKIHSNKLHTYYTFGQLYQSGTDTVLNLDDNWCWLNLLDHSYKTGNPAKVTTTINNDYKPYVIQLVLKFRILTYKNPFLQKLTYWVLLLGLLNLKPNPWIYCFTQHYFRINFCSSFTLFL